MNLTAELDMNLARLPLTQQRAIDQMNSLGAAKEPFYFLIEFDRSRAYVMTQGSGDILLDIQGVKNFHQKEFQKPKEPLAIRQNAEAEDEYARKFHLVKENIGYGNSFLVNLTCRTPIAINWGLEEIFHQSRAKYKVYIPSQMVCFSPETFIIIRGGKIASYPMKGTIDAAVPNAEAVILADEKEMAEHVTIVDLIRNDLSQVADSVQVIRYRYVEKIKSPQRELLQVSSEVVGELPLGYESNIGDLLFKLLPAGSISGAPKPKTLEIIREAESKERGFFTGICGYFDGQNLDSGVMIRYIEQENENYYFRSGGGITYSSEMEKEYEEMLNKIYVPVY